MAQQKRPACAPVWAWRSLGLAALLACGPRGSGDAVGDGGAAAGHAGHQEPGGGNKLDAFVTFSDGSAPPQQIMDPGNAACARQSLQAERAPLDLLIMMDSSGSMLNEVSAGRSKWVAVRDALTAFFRDPASSGLGIGLHYFPQVQAGVPAECTANLECGNFGPCDRFNTCAAGDQVVPCQSNADCGAGDTCVPLGICSLTGNFCIPPGAPCGAGPQGTPRGNRCLAIPGYCNQRDKCDAPSYSAPAVDVAPLPGAAAALVSSLTTRAPDGLTPTGPALSGVIDRARARLMNASNAGRRVAVVIATDGFPTTCDPLDINAIATIAAGAANASPAIPTFVVGVFTPDEQADATLNLNTIARAGNTRNAFVVRTNQDVTQVFLQALNEIRGAALGCEYKVPQPAQGAQLDYFTVNVSYTAAGGSPATLPYVRNQAGCKVAGGWYYDVDPASGGSPGTIVTCDATCNRVRADAQARVDILLGCATVIE